MSLQLHFGPPAAPVALIGGTVPVNHSDQCAFALALASAVAGGEVTGQGLAERSGSPDGTTEKLGLGASESSTPETWGVLLTDAAAGLEAPRTPVPAEAPAGDGQGTLESALPDPTDLGGRSEVRVVDVPARRLPAAEAGDTSQPTPRQTGAAAGRVSATTHQPADPSGGAAGQAVLAGAAASDTESTLTRLSDRQSPDLMVPPAADEATRKWPVPASAQVPVPMPLAALPQTGSPTLVQAPGTEPESTGGHVSDTVTPPPAFMPGQVSSAAPTPTVAPLVAAQQPPAIPFLSQLRGPILNLVSAPAGEHTFTVTVAPENFGPVTVRAHVSGEHLRVELFAPTDAGREALRLALTDLRRDLAATGQSSALDVATEDRRGDFGNTPGRPGTPTPHDSSAESTAEAAADDINEPTTVPGGWPTSTIDLMA